MSPLSCAVIGATGIAGQQFLAALVQHPLFRVTQLAASSRSAGKTYAQALTNDRGQISWFGEPAGFATFCQMPVISSEDFVPSSVDLVFSAVESDAARALETRFAATTPVISTASAYRYEPDVPILIPAINGAQAELLRVQQKNRGWKGFVAPIPNCTVTGLAISLAPLHQAFGVKKVLMTSMQATSGAGRSPGVIAQDITDNIVPYIPKEEEKVEIEAKKILGRLTTENESATGITPADFVVSATCTRVNVLDGHTETVSVALAKQPASTEAIAHVMTTFGREIHPGTHPSAPTQWITVHSDPYRPQPRRDRELDRGMSTSVGRIRPDTIWDGPGCKYVLVSHNTKMGAALGAILVAEDLLQRGFIQRSKS